MILRGILYFFYLEYFSPAPPFWECGRIPEIGWTALAGQKRSRQGAKDVCAARWRRTWFVPLRRMKSSSALRGRTPPAAVCPETSAIRIRFFIKNFMNFTAEVRKSDFFYLFSMLRRRTRNSYSHDSLNWCNLKLMKIFLGMKCK